MNFYLNKNNNEKTKMSVQIGLTFLLYYHIFIKFCNARVTAVIPIQQVNPIKIGFPPLFTSFTIFVLNPIAAIAIMIKNFETSFIGAKKSAETPKETAIVVIILAPIK